MPSSILATDTGPAAPDVRPTLLVGARPIQRAAWWIDPVCVILFIVLPIFCFAAYLNRFNYADFGASEDFLTPETFSLGLISMALMVLGILIGRLALRRQDVVSFIELARAETVLIILGWVTILAYFLLLGTLLLDIRLVLELIRGNPAASSDLRTALGRIPGVTSFIQFDVVYLALGSAMVTLAGYRPRQRIWIMTGAIVMLTFLRAVLASERLAFLEALAAMFVIPVAYMWRPSIWRSSAPFIGAFAVFIMFAAGEYFRSWQYYKNYYNSYIDFISQRFAGYFSTSINNGAGAYILYGQDNPTPEITSAWVTRFPGLSSFFRSPDEISMLDRFLVVYASPEFNNPGGFYAAYLDYSFLIASLFMVGVGIIVGMVHRSFQNKSILGLMLYPAVFLGLTDLIRVLYITDVRTLPIFLGAIIAWYASRPTQLPHDRLFTRLRAAGERQ